jgi:hypothetical protein
VFVFFTHEAAGALGTRLSLRPLFYWANGFLQTSGTSRREIAEACLKSDIICSWKLMLIDSFPLVILIGSVAGKPDRQIPGNIRHLVRLIGSQGEGGCYEWFDLSDWPDRRDHVHPFVFRPSVGAGK